MNRVILIGRLTKDPMANEKYTRISIAVNRKTKNESGNYDADFINCVAFGKTAELINTYFKKGSQIGIEGRIQTGSYEKNGQKVYTTDVIIDAFDFIGSKTEDNCFADAMEDEGLPFD